MQASKEPITQAEIKVLQEIFLHQVLAGRKPILSLERIKKDRRSHAKILRELLRLEFVEQDQSAEVKCPHFLSRCNESYV